MADARIEIDIAVVGHGGSYALRFWPAVPRVGDEILLNRVEEGKETKRHALAVIRQVVWGTSDSSVRMASGDALRVSLVCEWKDAPDGR